VELADDFHPGRRAAVAVMAACDNQSPHRLVVAGKVGLVPLEDKNQLK
jgi:hypothetical protein